jgi:hypothetical protein
MFVRPLTRSTINWCVLPQPRRPYVVRWPQSTRKIRDDLCAGQRRSGGYGRAAIGYDPRSVAWFSQGTRRACLSLW